MTIADRLSFEDSYDFALIAVRWEQLSDVMPSLAQNRNIPTVLFMLNNPRGSASLVEVLGSDRVLLGFPGAGGAIECDVVHYGMIAQQPTTLGGPNGNQNARVLSLAKVFRASGFRTVIDNDMDAWLSSHAFFVTSVCGAIYLAGGDCERLSGSQPLLELMVNGVREGFHALHILGQPVHPFALKVLFNWLLRPFAVYYWQRFFLNPMAEWVFARHTCNAAAEMRALAAECRELLDRSGAAALALNQLYRAIDDYAAAHEQHLPSIG